MSAEREFDDHDSDIEMLEILADDREEVLNLVADQSEEEFLRELDFLAHPDEYYDEADDEGDFRGGFWDDGVDEFFDDAV